MALFLLTVIVVIAKNCCRTVSMLTSDNLIAESEPIIARNENNDALENVDNNLLNDYLRSRP